MRRLVVALSIVMFLGACSGTKKIAALKPEPDAAAPIGYSKSTSFISLPVSIKLKDIESQTNALLTGLVYEDKNIEDDNIQMKVWKQAPIVIRNENGKIKTVLPLKVFVRYRIGTEQMGVKLYTTQDFNLNGRVTLLSDVGLTNWKLRTRTEVKSITWSQSPTTTVFGKQVPITYLINPAIAVFRPAIESNLDAAIAKSMDFKPSVLDALEQLSAPYEMSSEYESWLNVVPIELYATDAKLHDDVVRMEMGLKCTLETTVGKKPTSGFNRNTIALKAVAKMPDQISANIAAVSTYEDASRILTRNFAGQEFGTGSKKVTVEKVEMWHKSGKMVIALDLSGSLTGTVYLTGFPQYNPVTKELYFDQLDYALDTKSALMRTANWLASGFVLKKIQENCRYSIQPNLEEARKNMMEYLTNYSPVAGVVVNGEIRNLEFEKIELTGHAIVAFIKATGKIDVRIDGLKN